MTTLTNFSDSVRMPWTPAGKQELVVRPLLGILFNLALGAMAGAWVPRFLRYERQGHAGIRWHWPAFFFPVVWAFYRRLWVTGGVMAALPFGMAALFAWLDPAFFESTAAWVAAAILLIWGVPCALTALSADALLFHRVRREVRAAEASSERKDVVATLLREQRHTAPLPALLLGVAVLAMLFTVTVPELSTLRDQHLIRAGVAAGLAAVAPLQRQVEEQWQRTGSLPRWPDYSGVEAQRGAAFLDNVDLSLKTGRVRLALGAAAGALAGKALLLAPAIDAAKQIHWYCIAVDVPERYLPQDCRAS